ncbi:riboflavin synthase [Coxiella endosymbiont of Amblyomma nuttalli]|uniref:riboflavin synthase n=1 Tax=Coxiella endosymbiont of Amblyomma nuttalli TaxID=2749996 RepID=UPI001BAA97B2|nr:riboflavin synthase [Coxiella endosymbiont of Amblyomma nuttalli]QTS84159.1 Riboflavin synthase [Coxiella endosymbiont of Amblyomma nuttalli]
MFTGIVDHCGVIHSIEASFDRTILWVDSHFRDLQEGESIAVDGVCMTVVQVSFGCFSCDLSTETLACTKAGHYQIGDRVNLERALLLTDRLGGHLVSGHIDQTATVETQKKQAGFVQLNFEGIPNKSKIYLIQKGSIVVNGVSLTINNVMKSGFSVMLIPHTLGRTNLNDFKSGQWANIEFDMVAKIIIKITQEKIKHAQIV